MKKLLILLVITISVNGVRAQDKQKKIGPEELSALIKSEFNLQHSKADCLIVLSCENDALNAKVMNGETVQMFNKRKVLYISDCQGKAAGAFKTNQPKQQPLVDALRTILKSKGPFLIDFKDQQLNVMVDLSKAK